MLRKIMYILHLWLGIPAGLVVFIIALTGSIYTFQEEIQLLTQPYRLVQPLDKSFLPPSVLYTEATKMLPGKTLHAIKYNGKNKAAEAIFYKNGENYYFSVFLNPYTGTTLKVKDNMKGFFRFILMGHYYLWLPPPIGQPVVAWSTLIFVILVITGIWLWVPNSWYALRYSFKIAWGRGYKWTRTNLDLHKVLGIYVCLFSLILALTGLVWGFQWFANGLYRITGGNKTLTYSDPKVAIDKIPTVDNKLQAMDGVWTLMRKQYPSATSIEIHYPETDTSSVAANANYGRGTYWKTDYRYFNQYTLEELTVNHIYGRLHEANFADKLMRMNYDIHVGAIGGIFGKIVVFVSGLLIASLPITGYIIWWNRRKKQKP
ncbi:MAG: PepSY domain-containing protein [Bacteroidales bacterium]|nr:PepSY domain-containing protein [Bacteroidales bacterium]